MKTPPELPLARLVASDAPILRQAAAPVVDISSILHHVAAMKQIVRSSTAVGLAAPQIGVPLRVFVTRGTNGLPTVAINPVIQWRSANGTSAREGCMSFDAGMRKTYVRRADSILAEWTDLAGDRMTQRFNGFASRVFQHEADHLDGVCIFA